MQAPGVQAWRGCLWAQSSCLLANRTLAGLSLGTELLPVSKPNLGGVVFGHRALAC
jgi:hypothetical protein